MAINLSELDVEQISCISQLAISAHALQDFERKVLPALRTCFGLSASTLSCRSSPQIGIPDHVAIYARVPDATERYNSHYRYLDNPYRERLSSACASADGFGVIDTQDVFDKSCAKLTPLYQEFQKPIGMDRAMVIVLSSEQHRRVMLGLWRDRTGDSFDDTDKCKARLLFPVLAGAYARAADDEQHSCFEWLLNLLDLKALTAPVILLNDRCAITFANWAAERIIGSPSGARASGLPRMLQRSFNRICKNSATGEESKVETIAIDGKSLVVSATPVPAELGSGYVLQFDGIGNLKDPVGELQGHGLTGREVEVVIATSRGLSSKEIAIELGISHFTVQDHIKSVYRKLNVHNRVDLSNLLHSNSGSAAPRRM